MCIGIYFLSAERRAELLYKDFVSNMEISGQIHTIEIKDDVEIPIK